MIKIFSKKLRKCYNVTNYLIKHTTHTTGETFTEVTKIRDNETYTVVEAESKEEAREIATKEDDQ
nr:DUF1381 domain-containing protein [Staphylococcus xylosus]